jgi:5-methyltetrahydropteroyltriglutamate--homocysteine methyltransferase
MDAREQFAAGKISGAVLKAAEDAAVKEIVGLQERVGIDCVTDGEYRKAGWRDFLFDKVEGFGDHMPGHDFTFTQFDGTPWKPSVGERKAVAKLRRTRPITADDFASLKSVAHKPAKANLPTPSIAHAMSGDKSFERAAYRDRDAFLADIARIYREEIADLAGRGCTYLQMDEVPLALLCDPKNQDIVRNRGEDPKELIGAYIAVINDCIRDRPAGMAIAVHMCRGNIGHGMASGGYEPIAERMFNALDVDGFFLEYDTPRAGDFSPLRHLPKPKKAVLGLMTTKLAELEPADALKRRIDEAAKYVDVDRLGLSPQCGFASAARRGAGRLTMDQVERKLARVVEVARQVWGERWPMTRRSAPNMSGRFRVLNG